MLAALFFVAMLKSAAWVGPATILPAMWVSARLPRGWSRAFGWCAGGTWATIDFALYPSWLPFGEAILGFFLRLILPAFIAETMGDLLDRQRRLEDQAGTDFVTGAANRRGFCRKAARSLRELGRSGPASLALLDIDDFKSINDAGGHENGDEVLRLAARTLAKNLRRADVLGRLGGDEFAIFLPRCGRTESLALLQRLLRDLELAMRETNRRVTFSIGVVTADKPPHDVARLLRRADELMYQAKSGGKNAVHAAVLNPRQRSGSAVAL